MTDGAVTAVHPATGGWLLVTWEWKRIDMRVAVALRFAEDEHGRLVPRAMYMAPDRPINSGMLRRLSLTGVEAVANRPDVRDRLVSRLDEPPSDPQQLVSQHQQRPQVAGAAVGQQRVTGQTSGRRVELTDSASVTDSLTVTVKEQSAAMLRRSALYKAPPGPKPDDFYEKVAIAYERLSVRSNRPAAEIAEAVDVPLTTVHRWVKRARQLGYLPPGQKGRRG